ncbi:hypothetical protein FHW36_11852 [Chitinophaga polysaccharea]|uniref:PKD domain-containing protein n=1 Tax=Chitinophaga polysaccharea TaxID=1293035 RepID=A0A561P0X1_9BACT|nr:PKD domain-containing protein [Chitinophaga polysaccharea]TWF31758.1 hypothetical protein FHW36_11852 [Chitinophaga polysaccharea]
MMITRKALLLLIFSLFLLACENRKDGLKDFNDPPEILLKDQRGGQATHQLTDSVKLSKPAFAFMPLIIHVNDANMNIRGITMATLSGDGYLQYIDQKITDTIAVTIPESGEGIYRYYPAHTGAVKVKFTVTDVFGLQDASTMQLYVFNNLPPVAALEVRYLGVADRYEYIFDGSGSYDADRSFGGVISSYIFYVNNVKVAETTTPANPYIFSSAGTYTVKLQVKDNDGDLSKELSLPPVVVQ